MIAAGSRIVHRTITGKPHPAHVLTIVTVRNCENGFINAVVQREGEKAFSTSLDPANYRELGEVGK